MRFYFILLLLIPLSAWPQPDQGSALNTNAINATDTVDEVLVVGEQPGPGLWKIYKGEHVLWILGTYSPLPKFMQWRSKPVEAAIAESQEYILPPRVRVQLSTLQKLIVLPALVGVRNNPDDEKLRAVLSADVYKRWQLQKQKYADKDKKIEKWRPLFAIQKLYSESNRQHNLTSDSDILFIVKQLATQYKLAIVTPTFIKPLEHPKAIIKQFKTTTLDDMACFTATLERLESGMNDVYNHANAWATGNLPLLKQLPYPDPETICKNAVFNLSLLEDEGLQNVPQLQQDLWMAEAERALSNNTSTFAALPIIELYKPNGYLAALRAKGYIVEEP